MFNWLNIFEKQIQVGVNFELEDFVFSTKTILHNLAKFFACDTLSTNNNNFLFSK